MNRPALKGAQALGDDESAFFAQLKKAAVKAERRSNTLTDRFTLNTLLLSSFGKGPPEMILLPKFPAARAAEFWWYALGVLYPEYLEFLDTVDDAKFLLNLAEQEVERLSASAESLAPWRRDEYRRLATAVINTVDKFFRDESAAA